MAIAPSAAKTYPNFFMMSSSVELIKLRIDSNVPRELEENSEQLFSSVNASRARFLRRLMALRRRHSREGDYTRVQMPRQPPSPRRLPSIPTPPPPPPHH